MKISVDSIIDLFTLLVLKYLINTFRGGSQSSRNAASASVCASPAEPVQASGKPGPPLALNITQNGIEKNTSTSER